MENNKNNTYIDCTIITINTQQSKQKTKQENSHWSLSINNLLKFLLALCCFFTKLIFSSWFGTSIYPSIAKLLVCNFVDSYLSIIKYLLFLFI